MKTLFTSSLGAHVTTVYTVETIPLIFDHVNKSKSKVLYVCDAHTAAILPDNLLRVELLNGEDAKNWDSVEHIIRVAQSHGFGRDDRFVAFGGGVVCDICAFAASIYMRGCALTLVPTTLLAMVDAALGGKTAIDLGNTKNLVGTFYPAEAVILCPQTLETLSGHEYHNGLGEVLKHALLAQDDDLMGFLETNHELILARDSTVLATLLEASLHVKKYYIEQDALEQKGVRDALNLGHTFGHALESVGNLTLYAHGEAVAWGMRKALEVGLLLEITDPSFAKRALALLEQYGFNQEITVTNTQQFIAALQSDKKRRSAMLRFVIMEKQGHYRLMALDDEIILGVIS